MSDGIIIAGVGLANTPRSLIDNTSFMSALNNAAALPGGGAQRDSAAQNGSQNSSLSDVSSANSQPLAPANRAGSSPTSFAQPSQFQRPPSNYFTGLSSGDTSSTSLMAPPTAAQQLSFPSQFVAPDTSLMAQQQSVAPPAQEVAPSKFGSLQATLGSIGGSQDFGGNLFSNANQPSNFSALNSGSLQATLGSIGGSQGFGGNLLSNANQPSNFSAPGFSAMQGIIGNFAGQLGRVLGAQMDGGQSFGALGTSFNVLGTVPGVSGTPYQNTEFSNPFDQTFWTQNWSGLFGGKGGGSFNPIQLFSFSIAAAAVMPLTLMLFNSTSFAPTQADAQTTKRMNELTSQQEAAAVLAETSDDPENC